MERAVILVDRPSARGQRDLHDAPVAAAARAAHKPLPLQLVTGDGHRGEGNAEHMRDLADARRLRQTDLLDDVDLRDGDRAPESGRHRTLFNFIDAPEGIDQKIVDLLCIRHFAAALHSFI